MHGHAEAGAEAWAQARLISYYALLPHVKKNKKLKMADIMELPLFDKEGSKKTSSAVAKAYRLTPAEIEQWHAGTWLPPDEEKEKNKEKNK